MAGCCSWFNPFWLIVERLFPLRGRSGPDRMRTSVKGTFPVMAHLCYFSTVGAGEQKKNALRSVKEGRATMEMLPTAHPRDLVGMRILVIAACQHDALLGTVGMDPDAMAPLSRPCGIPAPAKDNFQSTDFHIFPVFVYSTLISVFTLDYTRCE